MPSVIKERLDAGELVRLIVLASLASPKLVEAAGIMSKVDGVWFDQEHSAVTHGDLELLAMAARAAGLDCFARVAPTDYATVMRPYEAGCSGVMAAQVQTADEVRKIASWAKFAPEGVRGTFMGNLESQFGMTPLKDYVAAANRDRWLAIQIETTSAVDQVEEIAAVEEVDLLFVGPADLSVNLEVPGDFLNPKCIDALKRVAAASEKSGTPWGALCPSLDHARTCRDLGARLFSLLSDTGCFRAGVAAMEQSFAEFME